MVYKRSEFMKVIIQVFLYLWHLLSFLKDNRYGGPGKN